MTRAPGLQGRESKQVSWGGCLHPEGSFNSGPGGLQGERELEAWT
jgi:hypothetical protein